MSADAKRVAADDLRGGVRGLNVAIAAARLLGLEVRIDVTHMQETGERFETPLVSVHVADPL